MHGSNRSIDSAGNSLYDDQKYNTKKKFVHDSRELSSVGKSIIGLDSRRTGSQPYSMSSQLGETGFSQASNSTRPANSIAYSQDGLAFGIVPKEVIEQLVDQNSEWSDKSMAAESIYDVLLQNPSSLKSVVGYASSFLKFLSKIVNYETNSKIVSTLLKIINKIMNIDEVSYKVSEQTLVSQLVKKLAESNVQIRQLVMKIFLIIMQNSKQTNYINMLMPYLGSSNWHIREEVLHLMIVSFLRNSNDDLDYYTVVDSIAKLLDDPKSKVRFTCTETLATLALKGDKSKVSEICYEKCANHEYNKLCDRFEDGSCPKFYEDNLMFDFPNHKSSIISRVSSRGSNASDFSRNTDKKSIYSVRSKIGESPLTNKEFAINNISQDRRENANTFADNYKNGLKPSERMKKFDASQPPLINAGVTNNSMVDSYGSGGHVTQNLRLLKTKMRVTSASSDGSDPYSNGPSANSTRPTGDAFRNSSSNILQSSYDQNNGPLVKKAESAYSSSTRKQKPVKADHQVLAPSKRFTLSKAKSDDTQVPVFTPKKSASLPVKNPYETSGGKSFMRSTQKSGMGSDDDNKYLTSEEIEKLSNPKASKTQLVKDLASKNWETQVNACNVLRSIAIHDKNLLDSTFFRDVLPDLIKIASSLRSSVCKNGLLVFQDLFKNCSKNIDDLESLSTVLIKKSSDTNIFISSEAERTLISMCTYLPETKVFSTLNAHASNRNPAVKAKVAKCYEQIIVKLNSKITSFREKEKLIDQNATYLSDANQEVRNNAKQAFSTLSNLVSKDVFEKL